MTIRNYILDPVCLFPIRFCKYKMFVHLAERLEHWRPNTKPRRFDTCVARHIPPQIEIGYLTREGRGKVK